MTSRLLYHGLTEPAHSLHECPTCSALLGGPDAAEKHRDWHRAEAERTERIMDRSEAR